MGSMRVIDGPKGAAASFECETMFAGIRKALGHGIDDIIVDLKQTTYLPPDVLEKLVKITNSNSNKITLDIDEDNRKFISEFKLMCKQLGGE
jgi:hypothetical protein